MMYLYLTIIFVSILSYLMIRRKRPVNLTGEHCLITGGSSGIGLALAVQSIKLGANVTLIARSKSRLEAAKETLTKEARSSEQKIFVYSVDIYEQHDILEKIVQEAERNAGPISLLINCAGTSVSYRFEDTPVEDFSKMMNVNYFGSIYMTRAVLPLMKQRNSGRIVFVSSLAGLLGLYGYTAYSGSKFAILGMAEALQMEVKTHNISITVSFPPDTDTPGFAEEMKNKPIETVRISESGGLYSADEVASKTLKDAINKKFMSSVGFEGWLLCTACSGTTPVNSFLTLVTQVMTMGLFRIVVFIYLMQCSQTIRKCAIEKKKCEVKETEDKKS